MGLYNSSLNLSTSTLTGVHGYNCRHCVDVLDLAL